MTFYKLTLKRSVEKDLRKIGKQHLQSLVEAMQSLSEEPLPPQSRKLVGSNQSYRLRVGDYRIVYLVNEVEEEIEVQKVRHRKDVYR